MTLWPIALLVFFFALGVPVAFAMMLAVIPYFLADPYISASVIAQKLIGNCESISLMAVPFFIVAGSVMTYSGITEKLMDLADSVVGHFTGGLGQVNVVLSTLMGGISGSGAADCVQDCKILVPEMIKHGYDKSFCAAVTAASACITPIIPPGVALVVFACICEVSTGKLLAAGYLPGILLCIAQMIVVYIISKRRGYRAERSHMLPVRVILKKVLNSLWALFLPFGLILALRAGVCTATEGGVLMALYSAFVGKFIYKTLDFKQLPSIMVEAALNTAPVMMILCSANMFSYYMTWENIPAALTTVLLSIASNKYVFLFACNIMFLLLGMFMDGTACMIIIAPLLAPVVEALGINMIHFGLVICLNIGLGAITPPFGTYIFLVSGTLKMKTSEMVKDLLPFVFASIAVLFLVTYVPWFATAIPKLMYGSV